MNLLPIWSDRVAKSKAVETCDSSFNLGLRKSRNYYAADCNFVETPEQAQGMLELAQQRPLSHIGFDTEFRYGRPGTRIDKSKTRFDPLSIEPLLVSLALVEPGRDDRDFRLYSFVVDLRNPDLLFAIKEMLSLPVPCCAHFAKNELFCLWKLGLPEPRMLWDTFIFEKLLSLGRHHHKYNLSRESEDSELVKVKEQAEEKREFGLSLVATCQRYGVAHGMEGEKKRLQDSFLAHHDDMPFSAEQIRYAAEDAKVASILYPLQIQKAVEHGLLRHCETVEMDWVVTNARIEWEGVRIDLKKRDDAIHRISTNLEILKHHLVHQHGIANSQSHKQLRDFFSRHGLLEQFRNADKFSFSRENLKEKQSLHPAIPLIRAVRRSSDLLSDKLLSPDFTGPDGRIRPEHKQLGTDTGRQTSRWPNLLGVDRILRPLVVPAEGCGIGEADWSQVEVGVAGAVYEDEALIQMFNSGDVYSSMAQLFFKDELSAEDLTIEGKEFKTKHKSLRNQMKTCTLGMLYGMTPGGLAQQLGTTKAKATALQKRFMKMFPQLQNALLEASRFGAIRGYANTISGLKRYRGHSGNPSHWEKNWLINHPVQGSAAVVFKATGNRLRKLYAQYNARIIIPLHDAFIFESRVECLKEVAELTAQVMCHTLQEYFPVLRPLVEVNITRPDCWNKDGDVDELERWIASLNELMEVQLSSDAEAE